MPELDYAVLCDHARTESGSIQHIIAAGINTLNVAEVPFRAQFSVALSVAFSHSECGRPHRVELHVRGYDGEELGQVTGTITPQWPDSLPEHWQHSRASALNFGVVIPSFSEYQVDVLVDDRLEKTLRFRVQRVPEG